MLLPVWACLGLAGCVRLDLVRAAAAVLGGTQGHARLMRTGGMVPQ